MTKNLQEKVILKCITSVIANQNFSLSLSLALFLSIIYVPGAIGNP